MKKQLTFIAMAALALLASCGSNVKEETTTASNNNVEQLQEKKPNVKLGDAVMEVVPQIETFTTTVEAEVKNNIIPNSPLRIDKIFVEVGDHVKKGQKLVQLDESSLEQLKLQVENQRVEFGRVSELYKVGGVSKSQYDNAKTSLDVNEKALKNRLENTLLLSPTDGVVTARNYDNGDMYGGQPIVVVEQISPVKTKLNVSEKLYTIIKKGMPVTFTFDSYGDEQFTGAVSIVYPTINPTSHTFVVEVAIDNKDLKVRPGMYGRAHINTGSLSRVVVPDMAAVKQVGSGDYYVYTYEDGKVLHKKVQLGRRLGDRYEIISGIEAGDKVVIAGQNSLTNNKEVNVIE